MARSKTNRNTVPTLTPKRKKATSEGAPEVVQPVEMQPEQPSQSPGEEQAITAMLAEAQTLPEPPKVEIAQPTAATDPVVAHQEPVSQTSPNDTTLDAVPATNQSEAKAPKAEVVPVQLIVDEFTLQKNPHTAPAHEIAPAPPIRQSQAESAEPPPQRQAETSALTPIAAAEPHAGAVEPEVSRLEQILAQGAKPRNSGRKAFDINLGGDGHTWERVVTPDNFIVFRFKDDPTAEQHALIQKYGFAFIDERKEAYRPNDEEGRDGANKLAWYLKQLQHSEGQALVAS